MLGQIILFLLFMGAEKGVNHMARRPLMNGALWYLGVASLLFAWGVYQLSSLLPPGSANAQAEMHAEMIGRMVGSFLLPVGAAIHYAKKFEREKAAASVPSVQSSI